MSPHQTMNLAPTTRMEFEEITIIQLIHFKIYDFSGNYDLEERSPPETSALENCGAFIYVIDVQVLFF